MRLMVVRKSLPLNNPLVCRLSLVICHLSPSASSGQAWSFVLCPWSFVLGHLYEQDKRKDVFFCHLYE